MPCSSSNHSLVFHSCVHRIKTYDRRKKWKRKERSTEINHSKWLHCKERVRSDCSLSYILFSFFDEFVDNHGITSINKANWQNAVARNFFDIMWLEYKKSMWLQQLFKLHFKYFFSVTFIWYYHLFCHNFWRQIKIRNKYVRKVAATIRKKYQKVMRGYERD